MIPLDRDPPIAEAPVATRFIPWMSRRPTGVAGTEALPRAILRHP